MSATCAVPQTIQPNTNYTCSFVGRINSCSTTLTDVVTGGATDDDGASYTPSDPATVIVNVHSAAAVAAVGSSDLGGPRCRGGPPRAPASQAGAVRPIDL